MPEYNISASGIMSELVSGKHLVHYPVQDGQDHDQNGYDVAMMQKQQEKNFK